MNGLRMSFVDFYMLEAQHQGSIGAFVVPDFSRCSLGHRHHHHEPGGAIHECVSHGMIHSVFYSVFFTFEEIC